MKIDKHRFTAIRHNGHTQVWDDVGWPQVFREMYTDMQSGGSTYSRFNMLLCDGRVIVTENVGDMAFNYCSEVDDALAAVRDSMMRKHRPEGIA